MKPFIVLDTNIWVGFCAGWYPKINQFMADASTKYEVAFTRKTIEELERVFKISRIEANTKPELRQIVLGLTLNEKCIFEVKSRIEVIRDDPSDN